MSSWKTVRVFISSTFRDMQAERDHLVRTVFPKLRQRLERRRVYLEDIDLRWGITKQQAENAETLDLCLRTIDECRPYFLGILGSRYGTALRNVPTRILQARGLEEFSGSSVTELEIIYGALARNQVPSRAFFFFRDPKALSTVPPDQIAVLENQDIASRQKLNDLKDLIRSRGCYVFDGYPATWRGGSDGHFAELEAFGERVFQALWSAFAEDLALGGEDQRADDAAFLDESDLHDRFMEVRTRVFVGRKDELAALQRYVEAPDTRPCLVHGNSGMGKSALLAKFALDLRSQHPNTTVIAHFVGASDTSADLVKMLQRLCAAMLPLLQPSRADEASRIFNDPDAVPSSLPDLKARFREFLARVPVDPPLVLVIDAIDQLHEETAVRSVDWLPADLGPVKVIISSVDNADRGRAIREVFKQRAHVAIELGALSAEDRTATIHDVPSLSAKSLDRVQIQLLASNAATASPLFLRTALEELRTFGSYEGLTQQIKELPKPKTSLFGFKRDANISNPTRELFLQILDRLEIEHGAEVIERILGTIAVSRRGLLETEIVKLAEVVASPETVYAILRQLRPYLFPRAGALSFYHLEIGAAVREKYLANSERKTHELLAGHFISNGWRSIPRRDWPTLTLARACEEVPWQLMRAAQFHAAAEVLLDTEFLEAKALAGLLPDLLEDFSRLLRATGNVLPKESIADEKTLREIRRLSGKETFTFDEAFRFPRKRLTLVEEVLRQHASFIRRHPQSLMQCLWNAAWWFDCEIRTQYAEGSEAAGATGIAHIEMSKWLDNWNARRAESPDRAPLLRSLHPPPVPLVLNSRMLYGPDGPVSDGAGPRFLTTLPARRRVAAVVGDDDMISGNTEEFRIWHADTGEEIGRIRFHEHVSHISLSSDGRWLAVSIKGKVRLYDVPTGEAIWQTDGCWTSVNANAPPDPIIALSGDAKRLAAAMPGETRVHVLDVTARKPVATIESAFPVHRLAFAPGAANLLVSGYWETILPPGTHNPYLPTSMRDYRTVQWDVPSGRALFEIPREVVRYSADGTRVLFAAPGKTVDDGSSNTEVHVRDKTGSRRVSHASALNLSTPVFALSENGEMIAFVSDRYGEANTIIDLIDVETAHSIGAIETMHSRKIRSLAFLGDFDEDKALALAGAGATTADALIKTMETARQARSENFVPAFVAEPKVVSASGDGTIRVASFPDGGTRAALRPKGHRSAITALCFSPDGKYLLSASHDATRIWRATDGLEAGKPGPGATVAAFFPSGATFVAADEGGMVRIVGTEDGRVEAEVKCANHLFEDIAVSHDGRLIAVANSQNVVQILSGSDLATIHAFPPTGLNVTAVDFHPCDDLLAITRADGRVSLIEVELVE